MDYFTTDKWYTLRQNFLLTHISDLFCQDVIGFSDLSKISFVQFFKCPIKLYKTDSLNQSMCLN